MLQKKTLGAKTEVLIFSKQHLFFIIFIDLVAITFLYFFTNFQSADLGDNLAFFVVGLGLFFLNINFFINKKIVIEKNKGTIRLGYRILQINKINSIRTGKLRTFGEDTGFEFDIIVFEMSDSSKLAFPPRFNFSISDIREELIVFLKKELINPAKKG